MGLILRPPPAPSAHALAAVRAAAAVLPTSVDLTADAMPVGNQGGVNSCAAWATDYAALGFWENAQGIPGGGLAPMYTYSQVDQGVDGGSTLEGNLYIAATQGVDDQADYTQGNYDWQDQPTPAETVNAANWKLSGYDELTIDDTGGQTVTQESIETALAAGDPVVIGIPVYPTFYNLLSGYYTGLTPSEVGTQAMGGHAVTALGYDGTGLKIENSWTTGWGAGGYATLSWSFVNDYVEDAVAVGPLASSHAAPFNTTAPSLSGAPLAGQSLTTTNGAWTPLPSSYSYQWQRYVGGAWAAIPGATAQTYTLTAADVGVYVRAAVTAVDAFGTRTVGSQPAGPVVSGAPASVTLPTITGTARPGRTLQGSPGGWTTGAVTYAYQWQRSANGGETWSDIPGAARSKYTVSPTDEGHVLRLDVTATNTFGSSSAASRSLAVTRVVQLSLTRPRVLRGHLTFQVRFVHGSGKVQAAAWRGSRRVPLRVSGSRGSLTVTGALTRGSWTVRVYVFPAAGWQAQSYSATVRVS